MLGGHVLHHRLVHQRLDVAGQHVVQHGLRVGLVQVVPVVARDLRLGRRQRQQLVERRALGHGVDEVVVRQEHLVDLAAAVGVQHHLDDADQLLQVRDVAEVGDRGQHADLDPAEEHRGLLADGDDVDLDALFLQLAEVTQQLAEHVVVEAAGQAAVGRHHDVADPLHLAALHEVGVAVLGVRLRQVPDQLLHRPRVGARGLHPVLRLADLGGRDHLERARHLAGVLHALDLRLDFASACHARLFFVVRRRRSATRAPGPGAAYQLPVALKSSMPFLNAASMSSFQSPDAATEPISSPAVLAKCACSASSNAPILATGTSSM